MRSINFRWPDEFVDALDQSRGGVSRSQYVIDAVSARMGQGAVVSEAVAKEAAAAREKAVEKPAAVQAAEEVAAAIPEAALKPASKVRLQCRVEGCPFTAPSPTAQCPIHPGKLVSL